MSETILNLKDVKKSFISGESRLSILKSINLEVHQGESIAVTGPSGCGKSTLLNVIGTLENADSGQILFKGEDITALNDDDKAKLRLKDVGFVFQKHHLLPQLTALENILLPTLKTGDPQAQSYAVELLQKVGLSERANHRPGQMSGGECQRTALCRALINKPSLLLADEPTGSLDNASSKQLLDLLVQLNKESQLTIISVTHSNEFAAAMKHNYRLSDGVLKEV